MKPTRRAKLLPLLALGAIAPAAAFLAACEGDDVEETVEEAQENVEEAAEDAADAVEDAADDVEDAVDDPGG